MEQSLAPGSQTFEQDLYRMYKDGIITLDEALANADSATNMSWLINNDQIHSPNEKNIKVPFATATDKDPDQTSSGASFSEFTLHMDS